MAIQDLLPLLTEALKSAEGGESPLTPEEWHTLDRKLQAQVLAALAKLPDRSSPNS